jgi:hypothetical protein
MRELRRGDGGVLGFVVPAADGYGVAGIGQRLERGGLVGVIGPPCRARVRTDSADSRPEYPGSAAHRQRLAATCSRTGSVTAAAAASAPACRMCSPMVTASPGSPVPPARRTVPRWPRCRSFGPLLRFRTARVLARPA